MKSLDPLLLALALVSAGPSVGIERPTFPIEGRVVDENSTPISDALLTITDPTVHAPIERTTTSGRRGRFRFDAVPAFVIRPQQVAQAD